MGTENLEQQEPEKKTRTRKKAVDTATDPSVEKLLAAMAKAKKASDVDLNLEEMNKAEGIKWLRKAADQENLDAIAALGLCYIDGDGVPEDRAKGIELLRKAAKRGHVRAKEILKDIESENKKQ